MKKIYIVATALLFVSQFNLSAQTATPATATQTEVTKVERKVMTPEEKEEKMTARMVQQLLLSDADAAKFTPLYKKFMAEKRALRPQREEMKNSADATAAPKAAPTDAEIKKAAKERFAQQRKMIDLNEKYYNEFSKILTAKQVEKVMSSAKHRAPRGGEMGGKQAPTMKRKGGEMRKGKEMGQRGGKRTQGKPAMDRSARVAEQSKS